MSSPPKRSSRFMSDGTWKMMRNDIYTEDELQAYKKIKKALQRHRDKKLPEKKQKAAVKIQKVVRGVKAREQVAPKAKAAAAAKKIQAVYRAKKDTAKLNANNKKTLAAKGAAIQKLKYKKELDDVKKLMKSQADASAKKKAAAKKESEEVYARLAQNSVPKQSKAKPASKKIKVSRAAIAAAKTRKPIPKAKPKTKLELLKEKRKQKAEEKSKVQQAGCRCHESIKTHYVKWESYCIGTQCYTSDDLSRLPKVLPKDMKAAPVGTEVIIRSGQLKNMRGVITGANNGKIQIKPEDNVVKAGYELLEFNPSMLKYDPSAQRQVLVHSSGDNVIVPHKFTYTEVCRNCGVVWTDIGETQMVQPGEDGRYLLGKHRKTSENDPTIYETLMHSK